MLIMAALNNESITSESAKFLLLDMSHPWTLETSINLIPAVKNILSLASHVGESRVPAFGLSRMELYYEELHPVSLLKGNIDAILESLDSVSKIDAGVNVSWNDYKDLLEYAVCEILEDFSSKCKQNFRNWPIDIQIFFVTKNKNVSRIAKILKDLVTENELPKLKSIDVIGLVCKLDKSAENASQNYSQTLEFGKVIVTNDSPTELEFLLQDWLTVAESRQEHLRINLGSALSIKGDISDCYYSGTGNGTTECLVFEFRVVERINISGISSSFISGTTKKIFPTQATRFNSEDLKTNEQIFKSLCAELDYLEQGLLGKLKFGSKAEEIKTYFFISSDGVNFYLNNVGRSELISPELRDIPSEGPEIPEEIKSEITEKFQKVPSEERPKTRREIRSAITEELQKIPSSEEYFPEKYSRGYKSIGANPEQKASKPKHLPIVTTNPREKRSNSLTNFDGKMTPGDYVPEFVTKRKKEGPATPKNQKCKKKGFATPKNQKCKKNGSATPKNKKCNKKELDVIHPAFLPEEVQAKLRKSPWKFYDAFESL